MHAVNSMSLPLPKDYRICQVRNLDPAKHAKYKEQIFRLVAENTFDPFLESSPSPEQRRRGFLTELSDLPQFKLQANFSALFDVSITTPKTYNFFVAIDNATDQIVGVMPPLIAHGLMKKNLGNANLELEIIGLIDRMITAKALPGIDPLNTIHSGGICVDRNYRGKPIAKDLLKAGIQWLRTKGAKYLLSSYDLDNQISAIMHKRLNCIPLDTQYENFHCANRPFALKILDLNQPLFKES